MRWVERVTVSLVMAALLGAVGLVSPPTAFACSCAPTKLAEFVGDPDFVIVSGTIIGAENKPPGHQQGSFAVARVFQGVVPAPRMPILGGGGGDCSVNILGLTEVVMVAVIDDDGFIVPGLCLPFGDLTTGEGRQLLDDAEAAFGSVSGPPEPTAGPAIDLALIAILGVVGVMTVVLFGAVIAFGRRDRSVSP